MAITVLVIVMVIVLNIIIGLLVNRFPDLELDLTSNNSFALQDDTIDYVSHLNNDVTVYILMEKDKFESQEHTLFRLRKCSIKWRASQTEK